MITDADGHLRARARPCHQMLLRLAGRAPDDLLAQARSWLAHADCGSLARALVFWVLSEDIRLHRDDASLLIGLLADQEDYGSSALSLIRLDDSERFPFYRFSATIPPELTRTGEDPDSGSAAAHRSQDQVPGAVEQAAVEALRAEPGAVAVWRAWRFPGNGAAWPRPKRVFVVEVSADADETAVAARAQQHLAAAGEASPQVEAYQTGYPVPMYQEFARADGQLLWAAAGATGPPPGQRRAADCLGAA